MTANQAIRSKKPGIAKTAYFVERFPHKLICCEWKVLFKLPNGRTYNPDFFCPKLGMFVEVCTSKSNYSEQRKTWRMAAFFGPRPLKIYWWENLMELTGFVVADKFLSDALKSEQKTCTVTGLTYFSPRSLAVD